MHKLTALAALSTLTLAAGTALAQSAPVDPYADAAAGADDQDESMAPPAIVALAEEAPAYDDGGEPEAATVEKQLLHGFRIGYGVILNYDEPTRDDEMSLKDELGLKSAHSMLLGYEAFYRVVGEDWLNVILVGNVTVAGLEQSKFIPTASGLIGAELNESFQLGVGVNLVPDAQAPTHMIAAAGWTPKAGKIQTPVHFFFVPDAAGNHRTGVTVGVTW